MASEDIYSDLDSKGWHILECEVQREIVGDEVCEHDAEHSTVRAVGLLGGSGGEVGEGPLRRGHLHLALFARVHEPALESLAILSAITMKGVVVDDLLGGDEDHSESPVRVGDVDGEVELVHGEDVEVLRPSFHVGELVSFVRDQQALHEERQVEVAPRTFGEVSDQVRASLEHATVIVDDLVVDPPSRLDTLKLLHCHVDVDGRDRRLQQCLVFSAGETLLQRGEFSFQGALVTRGSEMISAGYFHRVISTRKRCRESRSKSRGKGRW